MFELTIPFLLQGILILLDEVYFHFRRGLPTWERIGHPLDTLSVAACIGWPIFLTPTMTNQYWFIGLCIFSCLFVTKDEWVHQKECTGSEMWLHAVLYILHPLVFVATYIIWIHLEHMWILQAQFGLLIAYAIYQTLFWNVFYAGEKTMLSEVNNTYYNTLGERWYKAQDDPIALLRAESKLFADWIHKELQNRFDPSTAQILDMGCGGGFLSNELARRGWKITAIDLSKESLEIAKQYDSTSSVQYLSMDAERLTFSDQKFDAVVSLDMLEHVEEPQKVIAEASRVLKPGGAFFFHTFNRTPMAWLFAIKGLEWLIKNTPDHLHIYRLFITPDELKEYCSRAGLQITDLRGVGPKFSICTWSPLLFQGLIHNDFEFEFKTGTRVGYAGIAIKNQSDTHRHGKKQ